MPSPDGILRAFDVAATQGSQLPTLAEPVYFVATGLRRAWPELDSPTAWIDPSDVPPPRWGPGENIWVVSSYLRLRARGLDVRIVDRLQPDAINVAYLDAVIRTPASQRAFVVVTEGDRDYARWGEYYLSQSPVLARGPGRCLVDMWPQPGLLPRDPSRGSRIERIGYTGFAANLAAAYRSDLLRSALESRGVELDLRSDPTRWHDFGDLDLHLAVRDTPERWVRTKPSTKLVHSWLTGCPALLGAEPSYRYWGSDGEDYFEVRSPDDVLDVVDRLRADPGLYERVVARGRSSGAGHDEDGVCRQWASALAGPIRDAFDVWREAGAGSTVRAALGRRFQRWVVPVSRKWFFLRVKKLDRLLSGTRGAGAGSTSGRAAGGV